MEDASSEISDWEVLSAASGNGGYREDFVVLVSGEDGGGDVLHDHFALTPSNDGSWSGPLSDDDEGEREGLELVDGLDSISEGRLDLAEGDWSERLQLGGVDDTAGVSSALGMAAAPCGGTLSGEEAAQVGIEQGKDAAHSCGELEFFPQEAHHGTGENLDSDAIVDVDLSQFETPENSDAQLEDGGVGAAGGSSPPEASAIADATETVQEEPAQVKSDNAASGCGELEGEAKDGPLPMDQSQAAESSLPEAAAIGDAMGTVEEEPVQGNSGNAASGCDDVDDEAKDGSLPLPRTPGADEGERQAAVWWRLPFRLLQCCAWKVKPIWSFSVAAALLGLLALGRRMYRMRRKARGLPQIKIAFDDKKASQFADRTARLNEAFFVARRIPMLRTSSGAVFPWSMVQER
ncbi:hypothetical protein E2562_008678 [Oryza meyeriana var. granulata]|uniref:Uncharacterized protein n=1 Tax=Oryza meyeriana var. granulata TaxID=110450 RepID=A0A6G1F5F4_9ORYZ|nr:hypothetical protein E2562_008678 [Oryza meyeriana var. granulata]